jgi:hypothetical protein
MQIYRPHSQAIKEADMPKYRVTLMATASYVTEIEAGSEADAFNMAHQSVPDLPAELSAKGMELGSWMPVEQYHGDSWSKADGVTVEPVDGPDPRFCGQCNNVAKMRCLVKAGDGTVMLDQPLCGDCMKKELRLSSFGMAKVQWLPLPPPDSSEEG